MDEEEDEAAQIERLTAQVKLMEEVVKAFERLLIHFCPEPYNQFMDSLEEQIHKIKAEVSPKDYKLH